VSRLYLPKRPRLSAVQFLKSTLSCDQHRSGMMKLLFNFVKSIVLLRFSAAPIG
jgi:hypothetical protein